MSEKKKPAHKKIKSYSTPGEEQTLPFLNEPPLLIQSPSFTQFLSNKMQIIRAIEKGVPFAFFEFVSRRTPFTETEWAGLLDLSTKSLQRYRKTRNFSFRPAQSERIIEMAEVTEAGIDTFGNTENFKNWLYLSNFALGGYTPLQLLGHSYGKEMVMAELNAINQGILA
jgi:putative toxin-antitoxin system antitoxin component (TIGR02293 family)